VHWGLFLLKYSREGLDSFLSLAFDEDYYSLIESSFKYILKYLIVFSIISKSKKNIRRLRQTFDSISYSLDQPDPFVSLFESMFESFSLEKSCSLLEECTTIMNNNYFLSGYPNLFMRKCKEMILENHVNLNTSIEFNTFLPLFSGNLETTKEFIEDFFKINHPGTVLNEKEGIVFYEVDCFDNEKYVNFIY
jgi:hypothetical protein